MENSSFTDTWSRPAISSVEVDYQPSLFLNTPSPITAIAFLSGICFLAIKPKIWFQGWFRWSRGSKWLETDSSTPQRHGPRWYPHKDPILGLDVLYSLAIAVFNHRFLEFTAKLISRYGGTITYLTLGRQAVYTIDPVNMHAMLIDRTRSQDFGVGPSRKEGLKPLFGDGIFTSDGAAWKHHRRIIKPFLTRIQTAQMRVFETHVQKLIEVLPADGRTVDLQQALNAMTLDISTHLFFGTSTNMLPSIFASSSGAGQTRGQEFATAFEYSQRAISGIDDFSILDLLWKMVFGNKKLTASLKTVYAFVDDIIEQQSSLSQQDQDQDRNYFSDLLIQAGRSTEDIRYDVLGLLMAGKDSNASFLSSIWYVLAQRPDICDKIRAEISILDGAPATLDDLSRFSYLHMVLQEVLRLYPPVPANQRTAEVDTVLPRGGGVDGLSPLPVPRGASVGYNVYAMHRLPEYFGDEVDEFIPERWLHIKPKAAFMPFHAGSRTCIGQSLSMALAQYSTVRMLQHYGRVEDRNVEPWQEKLGLTCTSRHGVLVGLGGSSRVE
ncbi:cytochrome P450 [Aspergillus californicus]